jgi:amino acid adenylation domain-containing protein
VSASAPTAVELFLTRAATAPEAPAVTDAAGTIGYRDLERRARSVALALRSAGVVPGDAVIVSADRTRDAVVGMIATAVAGAAYVPLDPSEPAIRRATIVEMSGARAALADTAGAASVTSLPILALAESGGQRAGSKAASVSPNGLAYVLFTSGSTGRPKGVEIGQAALGAFLAGSRAWAALRENDVVACFHAFTFDISIWEIWGALASGARIVLVPRRAQVDADLLADIVRAEHVSCLCQTPTALRQLGTAISRGAEPSSLRSLFVAGERLDPRWLAPFADLIEQRRLDAWNLYGPTETTVYATGHLVTAEEIAAESRSLIGSALPHVAVDVVRADGMPAATGEVGELRISGEGVGLGYRGDIADDRFETRPDGSRVFRTGDLARRVEHGTLEYVGRSGGFVKIRGYRVEPDEVAVALCRHPDVDDAAVVDVGFLPGGDALAAAVVLRSGATASEAQLRRFLAEQLPSYMRPARLVAVDALPRLSSAKLDRNAVRAAVKSAMEDPRPA